LEFSADFTFYAFRLVPEKNCHFSLARWKRKQEESGGASGNNFHNKKRNQKSDKRIALLDMVIQCSSLADTPMKACVLLTSGIFLVVHNLLFVVHHTFQGVTDMA